ncbi:MAG: glycoside hydrolase family 5 protein [Oscillospiraceae bacterium]|nr:glycoside hydrolase family 5 protein [Oscillospiraceae bacterium]
MGKHPNIPAMLAAAAMVASLAGCTVQDKGSMRRTLTAQECAQEMGVGINLGNTMEAYWADESRNTTGASTIGADTPADYEKCWGAVDTTQACIDGMRSAGFKTIRVPVYWGNMMADDGTYTINPQYMTRVQEIVDYCRKDDLYVVINIHHFDEFLVRNHTREETLSAVKTLWKQIAEHFRGYSDHLVFEGFNEALGTPQDGTTLTEDEAYAYVNEMNQAFVDTVRSTGGNNSNRILIVSGYWTNIDNTTKEKFVMPQDSVNDKLMVSVHYLDNSVFWQNMCGSPRWEQYSKDQCELLKNRFTQDGIPVFLGECAAIYPPEHCMKNMKYQNSSELLQIQLDMAADYGFVPVLWDVNDNFYSRTDCKIKSDADQAVITEVVARLAAN